MSSVLGRQLPFDYVDMLTMVRGSSSTHTFPCDKMMIIKFYHDGLHSKMP